MQRASAKLHGRTFQYILTVQDIFSRYIWLRPLTGKGSKQVAKELEELYSEVGPPKVLQCDNGGEFKKAVEHLCRKLEVKIIRSSPYHPQSQGKVERSHRTLHKKIMYDLGHMSKVGVNWVSQLREYQKILNEEPMDVLGSQSPFEVFYGREANAVTQRVPGGLCCKEGSSSKHANVLPKDNDFTKQSDQTTRIRAKAKEADKVWDERYIQRRMKNNPSSKYYVGETVLIRFPFSKKSRTAPKRRFVLEGKIIKRNLRNAKYKISFENPKTKRHQCTWISVEDITSLTVEKEKRRKDLARERLKNKGKNLNKKERKSSHRKKYYIPLERNDQHEAFRYQGFAISFNPAGDGNCQFAAVAHALQDFGIYRSNETLRREVVQYLSDNPNAADGSPLELFAAMPWAEYLNTMAQNSTYGDQLSLQAMANLYLVEIIVISSLGPEGRTVISPQNCEPVAQVLLGHFSEDEGIHYVCLVANNRVHQESDEKTRKENENILEDGEENEHEQNDHENGIENDAVLSNDEQNVKNSENQGEQQQQQQQEEEKQEQRQQEQHEEGQEEGEVAEEVKLESLPEEVLDIIVNLSMTGHNRTIVDTYNALSHTSTKFKRLVSRYIKRLPKISANRDMHPGLHSMRQILKQYGRGSGLVMALKETINSPQWIHAWINLLFTGVATWMYVTAIFWKKGKK